MRMFFIGFLGIFACSSAERDCDPYGEWDVNGLTYTVETDGCGIAGPTGDDFGAVRDILGACDVVLSDWTVTPECGRAAEFVCGGGYRVTIFWAGPRGPIRYDIRDPERTCLTSAVGVAPAE